MADYFMTVVRTGAEDSGPAGLSLLCIDRHLPGVSVRKMATQVRTAASWGVVALFPPPPKCSRLLAFECFPPAPPPPPTLSWRRHPPLSSLTTPTGPWWRHPMPLCVSLHNLSFPHPTLLSHPCPV